MHRIDHMMSQAIADGIFPAAELLIAKDGGIRHHHHYGAAQRGTRFDIASLTKPIATATRAMQLTAIGKFLLRARLGDVLHDAAHSPHAHTTMQQLLSHTAGLPAWRPFYEAMPRDIVATPEGRAWLIAQVLAEPATAAPGSQALYSDLGFILLGAVLEQIDGRSLDAQFADDIAGPLGLTDTGFRAFVRTPHAPVGMRCAPTEDCAWRKKIVHGVVHDQNCYAMGGVAGHAGLFSTATDLHAFVHQFLTCAHGHSSWLDAAIIAQFLDFTHLGTIRDASHLCGWDTPSFTNSQAGKYFSARSIGHLGFTGCSLWIDLEKDWWVILLTNRVHPRADNSAIKTFRPQLHDAIAAALGLP